jgi:hypothetical protein
VSYLNVTLFKLNNYNSALFLQLFIKNIALRFYVEYLLLIDKIKKLQYSDCAKVA